MIGKARALMRTAALLGALGGMASRAPGQPVPPPPIPVSPPASAPDRVPPPPSSGLPPIPVPVPAAPPGAGICPAPACPNMTYGPAGGPPACAPFEDRNGPLLKNDPRLDPPCLSPPGLFGAVELDFVWPHVKNGLIAPVTLGDQSTAVVHLPGAGLDGTASPHFELGYRFPEGFGEIILGYHSLTAEGRQIQGGFDPLGDGFLRSRLNVNVVDLDYASREFSLLPHLDLKWRVGLRFADVYFDSQATGQILEQRTSNTFWGIGPHAGVDLAYALPDVPGLALYSRLDLATLLGRVNQSFEDVTATNAGLVGGAATSTGSQAAPVLHWQLGVSYVPPWSRDRIRFAGGYEFEQWWSIGQLNNSSGELTVNGLFFRLEFNY